MPKEGLEFVGVLHIKINDRETGELVRESTCKNLIVDSGKAAICAAIAGGTPVVIDTMKIGTTDTTFTGASTDLTTPIQSVAVSISSLANVITVSASYLFGSAVTIEEAGLFDGTTAVSLTNAISEGVTTTQSLSINWTLTLNT